MVTSVNVPYVTLLQKLKSLVDSEFFDKVASVFLTYIKEDLFETRTVHNTIWGYNETLFEDYDKFRDELGNIPFIGEHLKNCYPTFSWYFLCSRVHSLMGTPQLTLVKMILIFLAVMNGGKETLELSIIGTLPMQICLMVQMVRYTTRHFKRYLIYFSNRIMQIGTGDVLQRCYHTKH